MKPSHHAADEELLRKLLLGQLPRAEVERLAVALADDSRLAGLADTLVVKSDTLLEQLRARWPADDPEAGLLVERLLQRLSLVQPTATPDTAGSSQDSVLGDAPPLAAIEPPLPERLEHFRVVKVLGQGGMGTVYLAEDTRLGRLVALKTLKPELAALPDARERFLREARLAAAIEHEHIISIYHVGAQAGVPFLAMPVLKGDSLAGLLQRGQLQLAQVFRIVRQTAAALAAAHERGLIHRDIKPANIWLEASTGRESREFRVKVLDFGLARATVEDTQLTVTGAILGTPAYMAPEQARGEKVDARADLFSLGVVLYEMLTGRRPFRGPNPMAILSSLALDTPTPPNLVNVAVPAELSHLVMQLLEKDPRQRPASVHEVEQRLAAIQDRLESPARDSSSSTAVCEPAEHAPVPPAPRGKPRRRRVLVAAAVALLVLGPLSWFFGGTIIRFANNQGELVVRVDDKDVEVRIVKGGVVIQDRTSKREFTLTAGQGEIDVYEKDGIKLATRQFRLTRGGKTTVTVTLQELADARKPKIDPQTEPRASGSVDPDRRAAEYVLSIGGIIRINDQQNDIRGAAALPKDAFRLASVNLNWKQKVTNAGLAHLKDCKNLAALDLDSTQVTDAGLAHLKDCKILERLSLGHTQVTDAGLAHLKHCKNLDRVFLHGTQVTDAGLAHLKDCKNLTQLQLSGTRVTDAGLAHLKDCKNLTQLQLSGTRVTDAGLAHLKDCKNLASLSLQVTRVTDVGLAHLKDCKNLAALDLDSTQVTDAGLAHLKDCKILERLSLGHTQVTDAGLEILVRLPRLNELYLQNCRISRYGYEQLKTAMPACKIAWSEPNRTAADQVLALGGTAAIATPGKDDARMIKPRDALPEKLFQIRQVVLRDCKQPLGPLPQTLNLLTFAELDRLEAIDLSGTTFTDLGYLAPIHGLRDLTLARTGVGDSHLPALPKLRKLVLDGNSIRGPGLHALARQSDLTDLSLAQTGVADLDLARLPRLAKLRKLVLDGNPIRGPGLTAVGDQPGLVELSLACPSFTDLGAKSLAGLKRLERLSLAGSGLSDAGLKHLAGLTNLQALDLSRTKATAAGVAALQKALPKCKIVWKGP